MPQTIDSNSSNLTYAVETSLAVLPVTPLWHPLEPNSYSSFGGDIKTTMREPITATRQRSKGSVTDMDVKAGFTTDLTQDNMTKLLQGFLFAAAHEKPKTKQLNVGEPGGPAQVAVSSVSTTSFTTAAAFGALVGSILQSKNFTNAQNCDITRVSAISGAVYTAAKYDAGAVDPALVVEAAPPAAATLEVVGFALHGDVLLYGPGSTYNSATVVQPFLYSAATTDFTTLGLMVGEWVYLGDSTDLLADTGATEFNFFSTGGTPVRNRGYCRIAVISTHQLIFDLVVNAVAWGLGAGTGGSCAVGASGYVSLYFGTVIRNEPLPANIVRWSYTLQRFLGLGNNSNNNLESIDGAIPNELAINMPSSNKLSIDLNFVGMNPAQQYAATLAGTYEALVSEPAFNSAQDVFALFLYIINPAVSAAAQVPLFAYASDEKLTVNNNVKPNKAIGTVGAFEGNVGMLEVSGSLTCYFDDIAAQQAVFNNANVGLTNIFAKPAAAGGFILDLPMLTLALPGLKVEKDKPIMADITYSASVGTAGHTVLYNKFSYLPASAMDNYAY